MSDYIIQGGNKLQGTVEISGSKNSSLPILAATILSGKETILYNVPDIHDTQMMFEILKKLGGKVVRKKNKVIINTSNISNYEIPEELMRQMRSSVILAGSLLGKYKKCILSYPGGCDIGTRPIDLHLKSFEKLGINIKKEFGRIMCSCDKISGKKIDLEFPSVGATENIILASCLCEGTTVITNAAREPEIIDLQNFLNRMGAKVKGAGSNTIEITGVKNLKNVSYNIMPDRIETGTFLCMVGMTGGEVTLNNVNVNHIVPIINKLEETGCKIETKSNSVQIIAPKRLKATDIKTMPYPGFPTDMQSIFSTILTTARGTSIIVENIFENRYKYTQELIKMGAKITVEGKTAIIKGVRKLSNAEVNATDLRGGAALVIASLSCRGESKVHNIEYILRGYENFDKKIKKLGGNIGIKSACYIHENVV